MARMNGNGTSNGSSDEALITLGVVKPLGILRIVEVEYNQLKGGRVVILTTAREDGGRTHRLFKARKNDGVTAVFTSKEARTIFEQIAWQEAQRSTIVGIYSAETGLLVQSNVGFFVAMEKEDVYEAPAKPRVGTNQAPRITQGAPQITSGTAANEVLENATTATNTAPEV